MNQRKANRNHSRIVFECYMELRKNEHDIDKYMNVLKRYGRKTKEEAIQRLNEEHAKDLGMTMEEYNAWLKSED